MRGPPRDESGDRDRHRRGFPASVGLFAPHMTPPRTISWDPLTGKVVRFHSLSDGRFVVETVYDVQDVIDQAADIRSQQAPGWHGYHHHVGVVPMQDLAEFRRRGCLKDRKELNAWFAEYAKFRTKGRV